MNEPADSVSSVADCTGDHTPGWSEHPARQSILAEVHARPYQSISAPARVNHLVFMLPNEQLEKARAHITVLADQAQFALQDSNANLIQFEWQHVRIRWEQHTEFVSYTFVSEADDVHEQASPAWSGIEPQWLADIPGQLLSATQADLLLGPTEQVRSYAKSLAPERQLVGSLIADDQISLFGTFATNHQGTVRYVLGATADISRSRLGRYLQRVLEIETYRLMALMGLSHAQRASVTLANAEGELATLSSRLDKMKRSEEPEILDQITALATQVESIYATSYTRFSASSAYYELVNARVQELSERPIANLQSVEQFLGRRLTPAMQTCIWTNRRLDDLSRRIGNLSELLDTRVSLEQAEDQNELLETINKRQNAQLLLQSTVEGLSVAAITYYGSGIVSHLAKAVVAQGWPLSVETTVAVAVPIIAISTWLGLRRLHRSVDDVLKLKN
jgi:uncharacterized membrane-anchored protein